MAESAAPNATRSEPVGAEISDSAISADLVSNTQDLLDSTFGNLDAGDAGDQGAGSNLESGTVREVPVREHKRKVRVKSGGGMRKIADDGEDDDQGARGSLDDTGSDTDDSLGEAADDDLKAGEQPPTQAGQGQAPTSGVPAHLVQAALRRGRTKDQVDRLVKADPELATEMFQADLDAANEESRRFAELGRQAAGQSIYQAPQGGAAPAPTRTTAPAAGTFQQQQAAAPAAGQQNGFAFPKEYRANLEDDFNKNVLDHLEGFINQVILPKVQQADQYVQEREAEMLVQQLDGFFDGQTEFGDFYGGKKAHHELSQDQITSRQQVVQEADAIRAGAIAQGRQLSVREALERAHSLVTSSQQRQAARREVQGKIQQRERQTTLRPTHRRGGSAAAGSTDPLVVAEQKVAQRLRKLNG